MPDSPPGEALLQDVSADHLPALFAQQRDPESLRMAAMPARDRPAFAAHWTEILEDEAVVAKTIVSDGLVAGYVVKFEQSGRPTVGCWIGRECWGRGLAARALSELIDQLSERPLYACVVEHNKGSIRVLEKCGFERSESAPPPTDPEHPEAVRLELWEPALTWCATGRRSSPRPAGRRARSG